MTALWTPSDLLAATGGTLQAPFAATGVSIDAAACVQATVRRPARRPRRRPPLRRRRARPGRRRCLVHRRPEGIADGAKLLEVADTLVALHGLGAYARARFAGRLVAITGSVGKTTTKEMLRTILAAEATSGRGRLA